MTIEEFNATGWTCGMMAEYFGGGCMRGSYRIASCDFEEKLVGIVGLITNEPDEISWVRCENIAILRCPVCGSTKRIDGFSACSNCGSDFSDDLKKAAVPAQVEPEGLSPNCQGEPRSPERKV